MIAIGDVARTYTQAEVEDLLVEYLRAAKTAVTDWGEVGFLKSLRDQVQTALVSYVGTNDGIPRMREALVAGVLPRLADLRTKNTSAWLTLACEQLFKTVRNYDLEGVQFAGTFTRQRVRLTTASGKGPYVLTAGSFWVRSPVTGNRYVLAENTTATSATPVNVLFQSEHPQDSEGGQNYSDAPGTLTVLETPHPGLSASNVAPSFSDVSTTPDPADGLGVVTVGGSTPASATLYDFEITTSGQAAAVVFRYRSNGGPWITGQSPTAGVFVIPSGPSVTFTDDVDADPSFIVGDRYSFASPGTPITQQGVDRESDPALLERALGRWPDIEEESPRPKHEVWAKAASDLVTRVKVTKNVKPGYLDVTIAGKVNPIDAGAVVDAQDYIDQHEAVGDRTVVTAATVVVANPGGLVNVRSANLAAVQAAAAVAWNAYVNGSDIGGSLRLARLDQILIDAGAEDCLDLLINGAAFNLELAANEVAAPEDLDDWDIVWVPT